MRQQTQFFVHGFNSLQDLNFEARDYSYLKFGSDASAKKFGYALADAFFKEHSEAVLSKPSVVIPSPYNYVRNAATVMSGHFVDRMNHHIAKAGGRNLEWSIIHRKVSYIKDYGFLDKDKRKELIDQDEFYLNKGFLEGKNLILIDDVNITGTHEEKLIDILDKNEVKNDTFFLYFAKYAHGAVGANIEAALNFSGIQNVEDFIALTNEPNHHVIVRPIKFLMGQPHDVFVKAINELPLNFVEKLYYGALGEGYHKIEDYSVNFEYLSNHEKIVQ